MSHVSLHWTPGHVDFEENEDVDTEAKAAAEGKCSPAKDLPRVLRNAPLPRSLSAARQFHMTHLKTCWQLNWKKSHRYANRMQLIDPSLPSPKYLKAIDKLTRPQAAAITQLRIGHVPLNGHLFRIRRATSPYCPHCGPDTIETVRHFLIECRYYRVARSRFEDKFRRQAHNINFLLSTPKAFPLILQFIKDTKRLQTIFGSLTPRQRA